MRLTSHSTVRAATPRLSRRRCEEKSLDEQRVKLEAEPAASYASAESLKRSEASREDCSVAASRGTQR
eukprot:Skav217203  [mRNA]  locus=scaffold3544:52821:54384:+ [translate_table: standard]